jgi:hypothetical protein
MENIVFFPPEPGTESSQFSSRETSEAPQTVTESIHGRMYKIVVPSEAVNNEEQLTVWGRPQFHSCRLLCRSCKRYPAYLLQLHSGLEGPHRGSLRGLQATIYGTVTIKIQKRKYLVKHLFAILQQFQCKIYF